MGPECFPINRGKCQYLILCLSWSQGGKMTCLCSSLLSAQGTHRQGQLERSSHDLAKWFKRAQPWKSHLKNLLGKISVDSSPKLPAHISGNSARQLSLFSTHSPILIPSKLPSQYILKHTEGTVLTDCTPNCCLPIQMPLTSSRTKSVRKLVRHVSSWIVKMTQ